MTLEDRPIQGGSILPVIYASPFHSVEVTLDLDTNAYAAGDVLSNTVEVPNAVARPGGRALLHSLVVYDLDDQGQGLDVVLLRANVSLGVRNATPTIGDASVVNVMGIVRVTSSDFVDFGGSRVAVMALVGQMVEAQAGSTSIFLSALSQGTGTYTASGVKVRLHLIPE